MEVIILVIVVAAGIGLLCWFLDQDRKKAIEMQRIREEEEEREKIRKEEERRRVAEENFRLSAMAELLIQSSMVGDTITYEKVKNNDYMGVLPTRPYGEWRSVYKELMIVNIAGMNYRGNLSPYVGWFKGVLKPEPKNEYDPNAIMIKCEDGKHLGYVPEEETGNVRAFIGTSEVDFGPYRINGYIEEDEDFDENRKFFHGRVFVVKMNV